jgi:hypothetical protein
MKNLREIDSPLLKLFLEKLKNNFLEKLKAVHLLRGEQNLHYRILMNRFYKEEFQCQDNKK